MYESLYSTSAPGVRVAFVSEGCPVTRFTASLLFAGSDALCPFDTFNAFCVFFGTP